MPNSGTKWPFYYARELCKTNIWTGHRGCTLPLLHGTWGFELEDSSIGAGGRYLIVGSDLLVGAEIFGKHHCYASGS